MDVVKHEIEVGKIENEDKADGLGDLVCFHKDCGAGTVVWSRGFLVCHNCKDVIVELPFNFHREQKVIGVAANGGTHIVKLSFEERVKFSQRKF